ncbi:MAG: helix-turn-helix transcriptional regulator [Clostridia bacterium]|nr:helix-turn-helix transcriptional regulator [Clostridia bacterium]
MTDKKTFGAFIKAKRTEKNYSQKELAEMLFVTEGAISKWERGVSYPDITLIADICRVLDVSEHELITASTDSDTRKMKREARNFRVICSTWFWVPTISYAVALLICFVCNLAVNHKLSWFYIVLTALLCAYTFVPTCTSFFESKKLPVFSSSTYLSICLLLFTCAAYTNTLFWCATACIGVLIGYVLLFVPILLSKSCLSRYKFVISFVLAWGLTVVLLLSIYAWQPFMLGSAILITCYAFAPTILCAGICTLRFDAFLKAGICTGICIVAYYCTGYVVNCLFRVNQNHYQVNFQDWTYCISGNVHCICLLSFLLMSAVFTGIGLIRCRKNKG